MGKSCRLEILNRRKDMLRQDRLGIKPKEFTSSVASKYGISEESVRRDWSKRSEWMKTYFAAENNRSLALELFLEYDIDYEEICRIIEQETNQKANLQWYYLKFKIREKKSELLRQLGAFETIKRDFESEAKDYERKIVEKRFPWMKGNRNLFNKNMALNKSKKIMTMEEILDFEKKFI